jgi:phosphoglycolate phosphatase
VLFDVDGTLLMDDAYAHGRAMVRAMREVWEVELPDDVVMRIAPWGKTDLRIAREAVALAGVSDADFDRRRDDWVAAATRAFEDEVEASASAWRVRAGLVDGLERMAAADMRLSLVTGNLKPIAAAKAQAMGLVPLIELELGAYGNDAEERAELVPIARQRAGSPGEPWPREATVVVGDTPGDVSAARADSVSALIFPSDRFPAEALDGAAGVVADVDGLVAELERMTAAGGAR